MFFPESLGPKRKCALYTGEHYTRQNMVSSYLNGCFSILACLFICSFMHLLLTFGRYKVELYFPWYKNHYVLSYFKVVKYASNLTRIFRYKFSFALKDLDSETFHWDLGCCEIAPIVLTYLTIKFNFCMILMIKSVNNEICTI